MGRRWLAPIRCGRGAKCGHPRKSKPDMVALSCEDADRSAPDMRSRCPPVLFRPIVLSLTITLGRTTGCSRLAQISLKRILKPSGRASSQDDIEPHYVVDLLYVDALEGGWLGPQAWENPVPYPLIAELRRAQACIDKRLVAVCNVLTPDLLGGIVRVNRNTRVQTERRDRLLMHLFQHQIHHRGQVHAMLSGTAIKPPQLDEFFSIAEAPLRAGEFDNLGWTEEIVWGQ
jgi:uncharacterized damage-inducible protein DinB